MINSKINTDLRVLVVDDSEIMLTVLQYTLEDFGMKNLTFILDSREALVKIKLYEYDLVLTDINMPFIDGYKVAECVKEIENEHFLIFGNHDKKIPVFAITGSSISQILNDKTKDHTIFDKILIKPFKNEELEKLIAEI